MGGFQTYYFYFTIFIYFLFYFFYYYYYSLLLDVSKRMTFLEGESVCTKALSLSNEGGSVLLCACVEKGVE